MSASASGCQDDSKTQYAMNSNATMIGGHEPSSAPTATPPPSAQTWSVRARPSRTSAMWPQAGTASVKPTAPTDAMSPISAGPNPRLARMTGMKG